MEPRPEFHHHATSDTLSLENPSESVKEGITVPDEAAKTTSQPSPNVHDDAPVPDEAAKGTSHPSPSVRNDAPAPGEAAQATSHPSPSIHDDAPGTDREAGAIRVPLHVSTYDMLLLAGIFIMLAWPWIFLGIVWGLKGVQMNNHAAKVVTDYPHSTTFFVTLLGNTVSLIVSILFSFAIIRFAQELVASNKDVTAFDVTLLSGFRHQNWPWGMKDLKDLCDQTRWLFAVLVGGCIGAFAFVPSSTTSLIAPVPFNRTAPLTGIELDFSSSAPECLQWFGANRIPNSCDWKTYNDLNFTTCLGENQMVDVLESGRGNILSLLPNNQQGLPFSQLGARDGIHFLGPIRGVLPIGPAGIPAFNTLDISPLETNGGKISYNYTLNHQGFTSDISCKYEPQSPIRYAAVLNNTRMVASSGTCDGLADVLTNVTNIQTLNTDNTLTFWACKSVPTGGQDPTYYIYLRGRRYYEAAIGNITCAVTLIQPAVFPVIYQSAPGIFSSKERIETFANTFPEFIELALTALGGVITEAQNLQANLVAESVITFGVKAFKLAAYEQNEQYLRLYEAMIQGIIEYETTYIRLIYSTITPRPTSCNRAVTGSVSYKVLGWFVKPQNIGFLMPMTLVNLASLGVLLIAMFNAKRGGYRFDPLDPNSLLSASRSIEGQDVEWEDKVKYHPEVLDARALKGAKELKGPTVDFVRANSG